MVKNMTRIHTVATRTHIVVGALRQRSLPVLHDHRRTRAPLRRLEHVVLVRVVQAARHHVPSATVLLIALHAIVATGVAVPIAARVAAVVVILIVVVALVAIAAIVRRRRGAGRRRRTGSGGAAVRLTFAGRRSVDHL